METLWDPLAALFAVVGKGFDVVFALAASLASVFALTVGLVTLFFGRKLFWVFIGAAGFILGLNIAPMILEWLPASLAPLEWLFMLAIAAAVGALCIVLQRMASVLAGALVIGGLAFLVAGGYEWGEVAQWVAAVVCGLAGAFLLYFLFDWTLILVSALIGGVVALMGAGEYAVMPDAVRLWAYVIVVIVGVAYQARDLRAEHARARAAALPATPAAPNAPAPRPVQPLAGKPAAPAAPRQSAQAAPANAWPGAVQRPAAPRPPQPPLPETRPAPAAPQAWG